MNAANKITCPACDGRRYLHAFGHIEGGLCFTCAGVGVVSINHRAARAEVLTPAQTVARAEMDRRAAAQTAFIATFAGMTPAAVADLLINVSDAKVGRLFEVTLDGTATGAAELHAGAREALSRRGLFLRRAA